MRRWKPLAFRNNSLGWHFASKSDNAIKNQMMNVRNSPLISFSAIDPSSIDPTEADEPSKMMVEIIKRLVSAFIERCKNTMMLQYNRILLFYCSDSRTTKNGSIKDLCEKTMHPPMMLLWLAVFQFESLFPLAMGRWVVSTLYWKSESCLCYS